MQRLNPFTRQLKPIGIPSANTYDPLYREMQVREFKREGELFKSGEQTKQFKPFPKTDAIVPDEVEQPG